MQATPPPPPPPALPENALPEIPTSYRWFNLTQLLGALNDNLYKLLAALAVISVLGTDSADRIMAIGGAVFVVPFLLFSAWAGVLADRFSKQTIIILSKWAELVVMLAGIVALATGWDMAIYAILFLMATQSTFFGPAKYGIVPELVDRSLLSKANARLEAATYAAIIVGSAAGPLLAAISHERYGVAGLACAVVAVTGIWASYHIPHTEPAGSHDGASHCLPTGAIQTLIGLRKDRYMLLAVLGSAFFLAIASLMQLSLVPYGIHVLGLSKEHSSLLFLLAALGIAIGALTSGRLSGRNIELGIIPLGALGVAAGSLMLAAGPAVLLWACAGIVLVGFSVGLFVVPLGAWVQFRAPHEELGKILAAKRFLDWVGVLIGTGLLYASSRWWDLSPRQVSLLTAGMALALGLAAIRLLPDFLLRFGVMLLMRMIYRIRITGLEHVPVEGPALLVCNHVSWIDALVLGSSQQRRIRFLSYRAFFENRWLSPLMRLMQVIPIAYDDPPRKVVASLKHARQALEEGYQVCIFAEGSITRTGNLLPFRPGFERIVKGTEIPIVPVYIDGAWGTIFSYYRGRRLHSRRRRCPLAVHYGQPLPATATASDVRQAVLELSCDAFNARRDERRPLAREFVNLARRRWRAPAVSDTTGQKLSRGKLLTAATALARSIARDTAPGDAVGLLLPASCGGVLANLAVSLAGRVPVNLNPTASTDAFASSIERCHIRIVITTRKVVDRFPGLPLPADTLDLQDLLGAFTRKDWIRALLRARFVPGWGCIPGFTPDHLATVMFSSGTTATPKGIQLSHHNLLSNIESLRIVFGQQEQDVMCGVLPFFHSFGFLGTLWYPLLSGMPVSYHANPLDAHAIGKLVEQDACSMLLGTPTFLQAYLKRIPAAQFATLRMVFAGAERLRPELAQAFRERFGVLPMEGYGATELAPVAAINVMDGVRGDGVRQTGTKLGTVGHPVPGVAVRIVDPDSGSPLATGETGRLQVRGPNVMLGYLDDPDRTNAVIRDGWYDTGDIGRIDEEGFIVITGRLSRFSKIGGEMVPHEAVEDALLAALGTEERVLAVTSRPDAKRGERLTVLATPAAGGLDRLRALLPELSLPNLWRPDPQSLLEIPELPLLGSGKLDLKALQALAGNAVVSPSG